MNFSFDPTLAWFILGILFLVLEASAPGLFILFFGLGAWGAALAALAGLSLAAQLLTFIFISLGSLVFLRDKLKRLLAVRTGRNEETEDPVVAAGYLGREVTVIGEADSGRPALVEFNGSNWQARSEGEVLRRGDRVRVVGREGLTLVVTKNPGVTSG